MATAFMIIDAQRNMLEPPEPVPAAAAVRQRLEDLLARARTANAQVVHVQNDGGNGDPDLPGTTGWQLVFRPQPQERTVRKTVPNVFESNPDLADQLRASGIDRLVIAGMQSEWCIAESARAAKQAGFAVDLVGDAHATYNGASRSAEQISRDVEHDLEKDDVNVVPTTDVLFTASGQ